MTATDESQSRVDLPVEANVLRRSMTLLRPHPGLAFGALSTGLALTIASLLTPLLFGLAIDAVEAANEDRIIVFGIATIAAGVGTALFTAWSSLLTGRLAINIELELRNDLFAHMLELDRAFYERRKVGQLVSLIMVTSTPIRTFVAVALPKLFGDLALFLFAGVAMAIIDWRLAAVTLWPLPIVIFLVYRMNRVVGPVMVDRQEVEADVTESCDETLRGMLPIEVLNAQQTRIDRFDRDVDRWYQHTYTLATRGSMYDSAIQNVPFLAWAPLMVLGANTVIDGTLTLGTFVTFTGYLTIMLIPLTSLGYRLWTTERATASAQRAFGILDRAPLIADRPEPRDIVEGQSSVDLRRVSTSFGGLLKALDDVEFDIAAGRNVAIVGPTGSGKTSLLNLITRVHDPDAGEILVQGEPVNAIALASLRSLIARVGSSPHLFALTVRDNITYSAPATSRSEVERITRTLGIHDDIVALPDGYDTRVGATGVEIPLALAQGISIARAFVGRPGILLLDDVTAPFPPVMERRIAAGITELSGETTVVVVAARPALLALADDIVVLERGAVVGHGTFDELAERSDHFQSLLEQWRLDRAIATPDRPPAQRATERRDGQGATEPPP